MIEHDKFYYWRIKEEDFSILKCSVNWIQNLLSIIGYLTIVMDHPTKAALEHVLNDAFEFVMDKEQHLAYKTDPVGRIVDSLILTMSCLTKNNDSLVFVHDQVQAFFCARFILNVDANTSIAKLQKVFASRFPFGMDEHLSMLTGDDIIPVFQFVVGHNSPEVEFNVVLSETRKTLRLRDQQKSDDGALILAADAIRSISSVFSCSGVEYDSLVKALVRGLSLRDVHSRFERLDLPRCDFGNQFVSALIQRAPGQTFVEIVGLSEDGVGVLWKRKDESFSLMSFEEEVIETRSGSAVLFAGGKRVRIEAGTLVSEDSFPLCPAVFGLDFSSLRIVNNVCYVMCERESRRTLEVIDLSIEREEVEEGEGEDSSSLLTSIPFGGDLGFVIPRDGVIVVFRECWNGTSSWIRSPFVGGKRRKKKRAPLSGDLDEIAVRIITLPGKAKEGSRGRIMSKQFPKCRLSPHFDGQEQIVGFLCNSVLQRSIVWLWPLKYRDRDYFNLGTPFQMDVDFEVEWASPLVSPLVRKGLKNRQDRHIVLGCPRNSLLLLANPKLGTVEKVVEYPRGWTSLHVPGIENVFFVEESSRSPRWIAKLPPAPLWKSIVKKGSDVHYFRNSVESTSFLDNLVRSDVLRQHISVESPGHSPSIIVKVRALPSILAFGRTQHPPAPSYCVGVGIDVDRQKIVRFRVVSDDPSPRFVLVSEMSFPQLSPSVVVQSILSIQLAEDGDIVFAAKTDTQETAVIQCYLDEGLPLQRGFSSHSEELTEFVIDAQREFLQKKIDRKKRLGRRQIRDLKRTLGKTRVAIGILKNLIKNRELLVSMYRRKEDEEEEGLVGEEGSEVWEEDGEGEVWEEEEEEGEVWEEEEEEEEGDVWEEEEEGEVWKEEEEEEEGEVWEVKKEEVVEEEGELCEVSEEDEDSEDSLPNDNFFDSYDETADTDGVLLVGALRERFPLTLRWERKVDKSLHSSLINEARSARILPSDFPKWFDGLALFLKELTDSESDGSRKKRRLSKEVKEMEFKELRFSWLMNHAHRSRTFVELKQRLERLAVDSLRILLLCPTVYVSGSNQRLADLSAVSAVFVPLTRNWAVSPDEFVCFEKMSESTTVVGFQSCVVIVRRGVFQPGIIGGLGTFTQASLDQTYRVCCLKKVVSLMRRNVVVQTNQSVQILRVYTCDEHRENSRINLQAGGFPLIPSFRGDIHRVSESAIFGLSADQETSFWFDAKTGSLTNSRWAIHPGRLLFVEESPYAFGRVVPHNKIAAIDLREMKKASATTTRLRTFLRSDESFRECVDFVDSDWEPSLQGGVAEKCTIRWPRDWKTHGGFAHLFEATKFFHMQGAIRKDEDKFRFLKKNSVCIPVCPESFLIFSTSKEGEEVNHFVSIIDGLKSPSRLSLFDRTAILYESREEVSHVMNGINSGT